MTGPDRRGDRTLPADLEAVCFDLDDTLYPYEDYARAGLSAAAFRLREETGHYLRERLFDLYFRREVTEGTFDRIVERYDLGQDLVDDLVAAFHGSRVPLTPYDDVVPVLTELGGRYSLGVVTDGRNGRSKLERLGLTGYFDAVVVTPDIGTSKHDPRPYEVALDRLEARPDRTVYVGDDPRVDFRHPNDLGIHTVQVQRGRYYDVDPPGAEHHPDLRIDELSLLLEVLEGSSGLPTRDSLE